MNTDGMRGRRVKRGRGAGIERGSKGAALGDIDYGRRSCVAVHEGRRGRGLEKRRVSLLNFDETALERL